MKTMTLTAQIDSDGKLSLELPTGLPPGPADVVIVVQPSPSRPAPGVQSLVGPAAAPGSPRSDVTPEEIEARRRALQEYIEKALARKAAAQSQVQAPSEQQVPESEPEPPNPFCSGLFLGRLPEDYDIDAAIDEMNAQWKAKLDDLKFEP